MPLQTYKVDRMRKSSAFIWLHNYNKIRKDGLLFLPTCKPCKRTSSSKNSANSHVYGPNLGLYISLWLQYSDSHTNFYERRCMAPRILCRSQKLEASIP